MDPEDGLREVQIGKLATDHTEERSATPFAQCSGSTLIAYSSPVS
jgi:hypothetical protein